MMLILALSWQGWVTVAVFLLILAALIRELLSPDLIMLGGASVLLLCGIISPGQFLSGFAQPIIFILAMLFVIARAMEVNGVLAFIAQRVLPKKGWLMLKLIFPIGAASAFLNNTPIVLMLTGSVRKWAIDRGDAPSKWLIPISFAAIFGGMCTLIGTAPNLIVDGLLQSTNPVARLGFFELAQIGLPCLFVGYLYLATVGRYLLPERRDNPAVEADKYTIEFRVLPDSQLIGNPFSMGQLLEITRGDHIIRDPAQDELIQEGDRLVIHADMGQVAALYTHSGLESLADPGFRLNGATPHIAEVVVAINSRLVGRSVSGFRQIYHASVIGIYREGRRISVSAPLRAGDTLILLADHLWKLEQRHRHDLYGIRIGEELPLFRPKRALLVVGILAALVIAVTLGFSILYTSLGAAALLILTRTLSIAQARRGIEWSLLLLVATAFAVGTAVRVTGVADLFASGILAVVGKNPHLLVGGIFLITMLITEVVTNAASALMLFPMALETASLAGYDSISAIKAMGITVAIAASSSFLTPIGYQTNTIVYGPGAYRFSDYARIGAFLSLSQLLLASWLIPIIWKF